VPTVELRAAMILGPGGGSWQIVRDLSARLPAMVLPKWLEHTSWPVFIDDVVRALVYAADMPLDGSTWLDVPGAERIAHRALLQRVARAMRRTPRLLNVPVLTPRLSSYWIALVTRADLALAKELVEGLRSNLEPSGPTIWKHLPSGPTALDVAIERTLAREEHGSAP
jgi:nucleoside-diphosphate-sugar epimerase